MKTLIALMSLAGFASAQPTPLLSDLDLYYLGFLRPSPDRKPLPKADAERIQSAHMANIQKMAKDGVLVAAGPMGDNPTTISGIFIFKTASLEEAQRIAAQDPTVTGHRNTIDVHPWRAPKGIGAAYATWRKENPDVKDEMVAYQLGILKKGPKWPKEQTPESQRVMAAHFEFLTRMDRENHLASAGPFLDESDIAGIYVFRVGSIEEAQKLVAQDPGVKEGFFLPEMHRWWCADHVLAR